MRLQKSSWSGMQFISATGPKMFGILAIVLGGLFPEAQNAVCATDEMDAIVASVRASELLYANREVRWREAYRNLRPHQTGGKDQGPQPIESSDLDGWCVCQDDMFFLECKGSRVVLGPESHRTQDAIHGRRGFDGSTTRLLERLRSYVGNISTGPLFDTRMLDPHTIPIRGVVAFPLSAYLAGISAIRAHPRGQDFDFLGSIYISRYDGQETIGGLKCERIIVNKEKPDNNGVRAPSAKRVFWLAVDRNYLPIKSEAYLFFYSKDIPIESCLLDDLREIAPGVWFPFKSTKSVMDQVELLERKTPVVAATTEWLVTDVSLSPKYENAFFRDVQFPDGTPVYEVSGKTITRSYVQGDKPVSSAPRTRRSSPRVGWLLLLNGVVISIVGCWIVARRVRRNIKTT